MSSRRQPNLLRLCIASLLLLPLLLLYLTPSSPPLHTIAPPLPTTTPSEACKATRFPDLCLSSLPSSPSTPASLLLSSLSYSLSLLPSSQSLLLSLPNDPSLLSAPRNCLHFLHLSSLRLSSASLVLTSSPLDALAWTSAALHYQYDCLSALKYVNTTQQVHHAMLSLLSLSAATSNALSLLSAYLLFGNSTSLWRPPATERHGHWSPPGPSAVAPRGGVPPDLPPNAKVRKGGGDGYYSSVQDAVDAVPDHGSRLFVIQIAAGTYDEIVRVSFRKTNVVFIGEGMGRTVIAGSRSVQMPGVSTYDTATVAVDGDGFMALDLTIENSAGPDVHQAVAFRCDSDHSIMERVEFLGHQDTLYARSLRQYYKSCRIAGTVDFVFGNSATVFRDCILLVRPRQRSPEKGERNTITAQGRTDPAQSTGFVFWNCAVNGTEEYMRLYRRKPAAHRNYLGRPWKEYSRTVFLNCYLGELIKAEGWFPWRGDFALSTLFYGEFGNSGPGANVAGRVPWSSQIPEEHVGIYSEESFIQGDGWIPLKGS